MGATIVQSPKPLQTLHPYFCAPALGKSHKSGYATILMRSKLYLILMLAGLLLSSTGCGTFMANRMAQAPNTYPAWFAPKARVSLGFPPKFLTNFPAFNIEV